LFQSSVLYCAAIDAAIIPAPLAQRRCVARTSTSDEKWWFDPLRSGVEHHATPLTAAFAPDLRDAQHRCAFERSDGQPRLPNRERR
jgi:hypothetical protein